MPVEAEKPSAAPDEKTPLLGKARGIWDSLRFWWCTETTAGFRFAVLYSFRVAVFTGIVVSLPLLIPHGRKRFSDFGIPVHLIVCNMLFTIGPNVGSTLASGIRAMVGSLMAGLMIHALASSFPGWNVPVVPVFFWSFLYLFAVLVLNINEGIRFFAIGEYLFHMMNLLNPAVTFNSTSALWRVDVFAGSLLALLCSLLPQPIYAMDTLRGAAKDLVTSVLPLTRRSVEYYCGTSPSLEYYELVAEMQVIKEKLSSAKSTLEASWFECLGFGSNAVSRLMLGELIDEMRICVLHLQPLAPVCGRETFDEGHARLAGHLRRPLLAVCDQMSALGESCVKASLDGVISEEEADMMRGRVQELRGALRDLGHALAEEAGHAVTETTTGEHAVVCSVRHMAQHVMHRTEALIAWESPLSNWVSKGLDTVRCAFMVSPMEFKWACRNFFTLWICIMLGSFAFHYLSFFEPFTAGPAYIVAVLLSRYVTCGLSNAKTRVAMVVMAKVIGQAGWIGFGYCRLRTQLATLVLNMVFVQSFMFFAYTGGDNASFATRMAAIGVLELLHPCSEKWVTPAEYGKDYHEVIDNVMGVAILLLVDMTLGGKPASITAVESMREALSRFQKLFAAYFRGQKNEQVAMRDVRTVQSMVDTAASAAILAREEATLWRKPWRPDLFTDLVIYMSQLCQELLNIAHVLGDDVRPLNSLPAFRQTCETLVRKVDCTVELATAALRHDAAAIAEQAKRLPYDPEDAGKGLEHLDKLVKELDLHAAKLVPAQRAFFPSGLPKKHFSEPAAKLEKRLEGLEASAAGAEKAKGEEAEGAEKAPEESTRKMQSLVPRLSLAVETLLSVSDVLSTLQRRIIVLKYR